jgi:hypothetical protein
VAIAGAALATAAILVVAAILAWPTLRGGPSGHTASPTTRTTTPAAAANQGLQRTPRLGLEFWQNGAQDAMSFAAQGGKDVVTVSMRAAPFELRFPKLGKDVALQVCAWGEDSVFSVQDGAAVSENPYFRPGTGVADYEYGSATLYLNNEGHNHLVGTRIATQSADESKVSFGQTYRDQQATPLQNQRGALYLTVFVDKDKDNDGRFRLTGPAEYEFVVLRF